MSTGGTFHYWLKYLHPPPAPTPSPAQAFNAAFHSIGMDCVQWSAQVYNDLLGFSDGTGEGLITTYYSTGGSWQLIRECFHT